MQPLLSPLSGNLAVGSVLVYDAVQGKYVLSTLANRTALNATSAAVLVQNYGGIGYGIAAWGGPLPPELTGLTAGSISKVRVSDAGILERVAVTVPTDDIAGTCDASGLLHAAFGGSSSGSGASLPLGQGALAAWNGVGGTAPALFYPTPDQPLDATNVLSLPYTKYFAGTPTLPSQVAGAVAMQANSVLVIGADGLPVALSVQPNSNISYDVAQGLLVERLRGTTADRNIRTDHKRYNRSTPTSTSTLLANEVGRFGEKDTVEFAAAASALTVTFQWKNESVATFDIRVMFTLGSNARTFVGRYKLVKTGGTLTLTAISALAAETGADAIATVAAALSVVSNALVLTLTPNALATACSWSLDGDITRRV